MDICVGGTVAGGWGEGIVFVVVLFRRFLINDGYFWKGIKWNKKRSQKGVGCETRTHLVARAATKRKIKLRKSCAKHIRVSHIWFLLWKGFREGKIAKRRRWALGRKLILLMCFHDHRRATPSWGGLCLTGASWIWVWDARLLLSIFLKRFFPRTSLNTVAMLQGREYVMKFLMNFKTCP